MSEKREVFKESYCKDCTKQKPRPDDWNWSFEWEKKKQRPQKLQLILKNMP